MERPIARFKCVFSEVREDNMMCTEYITGSYTCTVLSRVHILRALRVTSTLGHLYYKPTTTKILL